VCICEFGCNQGFVWWLPDPISGFSCVQVILKPDPGNSQELYLGSLAALGKPNFGVPKQLF
jgi:hypothetical protein